MLVIEILEIETLILGEEQQTDGLDDTIVTTEVKHSVNVSNNRGKICLCLHCNASSSGFVC